MDKDKAIQLLERLQDPEPYEPMLTKDAYDAIQMAIDALSADGDTISRKAAIEALVAETIYTKEELKEYHEANSHRNEWVNGIYDAVEVIEQLLPAQPERIKGHWIKISPANIYECSECGKSVMTNDICAYDFCHGCGADMREVTE